MPDLIRGGVRWCIFVTAVCVAGLPLEDAGVPGASSAAAAVAARPTATGNDAPPPSSTTTTARDVTVGRCATATGGSTSANDTASTW